jgi:hypothetical protein
MLVQTSVALPHVNTEPSGSKCRCNVIFHNRNTGQNVSTPSTVLENDNKNGNV